MLQIKNFIQNKTLKYFLYNTFLTVVIILVVQLNFISDINKLFLDQIQGQIPARSEIIVVGIDDSSLQKIGSWPWDRTNFANAFSIIDSGNPSVIGIDVLFLEDRVGDDKVIESLNQIGTPIVFGSKLVEGKVFTSIYSDSPNSLNGFVNLEGDSDGKIRKSHIYQTVEDNCVNSFTLEIIKQYFRINDSSKICGSSFEFRNNKYTLNNDNSLEFSYTKDDFTYVSFSELLEEDFDASIFRGKIVLIGSTALDLRLGLNDNFTDIFGESIPGIQIHANIVNNYLNNSFLQTYSYTDITIFYLIITFVLAYIYLKVKKTAYNVVIFIVSQTINFLVVLVFIQFNTLWFFIQTAIVLLANYIFVMLYKYITQSKENAYIKNAFSKYLSPKLLNTLLQNTNRLSLGGETRNMSVLFSDIRSFTTISEKMSSQELITMINDYLSYMTHIILEHNGTIDKYIGDAIMAFWNAPLDDENHAYNSVVAAIDMKNSLADFIKKHPEYPTINIGIGINTGDMTVGNVGGENRFDYTVLGDNVNLGSRLEGLTKKYGVTIIVSESTKNQITDFEKFIFRFLDDMIVKGKNDSVRIYEPLENTPENIKIKEIFEQGFDMYQKGDFKEAIKILQQNKSDKASEYLIERCKTLIQNPPETWKGIWKWEEK